METIAVFTKIFRYEDSAKRAIESVLSQTFKDFRYYLLVNESTQNIAAEYASKDLRVSVLHAKNENDNIKNYLDELSSKHSYIFILDGDDWLDINCLQLLYLHATTYNLDITFCGNSFEKDGTVQGFRQIHNSIALSKIETLANLPKLYQFLRTFWGKLWKSSLFKKIDSFPDDVPLGSYGGDTLNCFCLLNVADTFGGIAQCAYHYSVSDTSISQALKSGRHKSDAFLFNYVLDILKKYPVALTKENLLFLLNVYLFAIIDTLKLINQTTLTPQQKCELFLEIVDDAVTHDLFNVEESEGAFTPNQPAFLKFAIIIFQPILESTLDKKDFLHYYPIFKCLYPKYLSVIDENLYLYITSHKELFVNCITLNDFALCEQLLKNLTPETICLAEKVIAYINTVSTDSLLKSCLQNKDFVVANIELLIDIYHRNYPKVIAFCKQQLLSQETLPFRSEIIDVLINASASIEDVDSFLNGKIYKLEWLYTLGQREKAQTELQDLLDMGIDSDLIKNYQQLLN